MSSETIFPTVLRPQTTGSSTSTESNSSVRSTSNRRSFLKHGMVAGAAAAVGTGILARGVPALADETNSSPISKGDAAILRFSPPRNFLSRIFGSNTPSWEGLPLANCPSRQPHSNP